MSSRSNLVVSRLLQLTYDDTSSTEVLYRGCCNLSSAEKGRLDRAEAALLSMSPRGLRRQLDPPSAAEDTPSPRIAAGKVMLHHTLDRIMA